jgi:type IX secretion system substrate protein
MMKKITFLFSILFCASLFMSAQNSGTRIWYEDFDSLRFANDYPEGWILRDNTGNDFNWTWSLVGPRGRYTSPNGDLGGDSAFVHADPLQSATYANGFMMMEADYFNTDIEGQQADNLIQVDAYFITPAIDLSDYDGAILRVNQYFRYSGYTSSTTISVFISSDFDPTDIDSGTWTEFSLKEGVNASHYSDDPDVRDVNISSAVAGKSEVYLKFHIANTAQYFWMLDDIEILEPFDNDLILDNFWADYSCGPDNSTSDSLDNWCGGYASIPVQLVQDFVSFRAAFSSMGHETQNNTRLNVNITRDGTEVYDYDSDPMAIAFFQEASIALETEFTPDGVGQYQVSATIVSENPDSYPDNNHALYEFEVSDTVYSRSSDNVDNYSFISTSMIGGGADGNNLCVALDVPSSDQAINFSSVTTYIHPAFDEQTISLGNASMTARVYEYNEATNSFDISPYMSSENYQLQVADIGSFVTLPLIDEGNGATESGLYAVGFEFFMSGSNRNFFIGNDMSVVQPANSAFGFIGSEWEEIDFNPVIMLNMKSVTDVETIEFTEDFSLGQNYPNPFTNETNIDYTVDYTNNVRFEVYDITGKLVMAKELGVKQSGKYNLSLNAKDLNRGIYMYRLMVGENSQTRRMIIK